MSNPVSDVPDIVYHDAEFGAAEVARLTGVSPEMQRDWRRRGVIVMEVEGKARFYTDQVAQILIRKALNDVGVPLTTGKGAVAMYGIILADRARLEEGGLSYDEGLTESERKYLDDDSDQIRSHRFLLVPHPFILPSEIEEKTGTPMGKMFMGVWPVWPANNFDAIASTAETFQIFGRYSFSIVDIEAMAVKLARDAGRPLARAVPGQGKSRSRTAAYVLENAEDSDV